MPEVTRQVGGRAGVQIRVPFCSGSDALTGLLLRLRIHVNGGACQNLGGEKEQSHFACPPHNFFFLVTHVACGILVAWTRDQTLAPCNGSMDS